MFSSNQFTKRNQYVKSITLELKPVGATSETIKEQGVLDYDKDLQDRAERVQNVADDYYRDYITDHLEQCDVDFSTLYQTYLARNDEEEKFKEVEAKIAELIEESLQPVDFKFTELFDATMLKAIIPGYINMKEYKNADELFNDLEQLKNCASIFKKYFTARRSMFTSMQRDTYPKIVSRCVRDNFPIFVNNLFAWRRFYQAVQTDSNIHLDASVMKHLHELDALFSVENYTNCLSQNGIDAYNSIISGDENFIGFNRLVKETNDANKGNDLYKGPYFSLMKKLKKQILSDRISFSMEVFETDEDVTDRYNSIISSVEEATQEAVELIRNLPVYCNGDSPVFVEGNRLSTLSHIATGDYTYFANLLFEKQELEIIAEKLKKRPSAKAKLSIKEDKAIKSAIKKGHHSLAALNDLFITQEENAGSLFDAIILHAEKLDKAYRLASSKLHSFNNGSNKPSFELGGVIKGKEDIVIALKGQLDAILDITRYAKVFNYNGEEFCNGQFYDSLYESLSTLREANSFYNKLRNYITKSAGQGATKEQTCFNKPSLFQRSWTLEDESFIRKNEQCLLVKDGRFYYGTPSMSLKSPLSVYDKKPTAAHYEKIGVERVVSMNKNLPRFCISSIVAKNHFTSGSTEPVEILKSMDVPFTITYDDWMLYQEKKFLTTYKKVNEEEFKNALTRLIDFFIRFMKCYQVTNKYDLSKLRAPEEYSDLSDFYSDCEVIMHKYVVSYVLAADVEALVKRGEMYLFMLDNKSLYKYNCKDTYALYMTHLLSKENMETGTLRINGNPTVSLRKACVERKITHPAGSVLVNRTNVNGDKVPSDLYLEFCAFYNGKKKELSPAAKLYEKYIVTRVAPRDLIKDKHFTEDKWLLTISFSVNGDAVENRGNLSQEVRDLIKKNHGCNILSVHRGESNLLYYTMMDYEGNLLYSKSLNSINGVDYYQKLKQIDIEKKQNQQNWKYEKSAKNLKEGYIGFAISEIIKTALDNNAIICIESLNQKFKDKRSCLDNQVYQKFELLLLNRLSCYFTKDVDANAPGGILNPLCLANKDFAGAQNGILFTISPAYTANICPETGFVNLFDLSNVKSLRAKKDFLSNMTSLQYNDKEKRFEFEFDYGNFECKIEPIKTDWTVNTGIRSKYNKEKNQNEEINLTKELKNLLQEHDVVSLGNIFPQVLQLPNETVGEIFNIFRQCLQIRVATDSSSYVVSPVTEYDSRHDDKMINGTYEEHVVSDGELQSGVTAN